jgi:hypothetical protein
VKQFGCRSSSTLSGDSASSQIERNTRTRDTVGENASSEVSPGVCAP